MHAVQTYGGIDRLNTDICKHILVETHTHTETICVLLTGSWELGGRGTHQERSQISGCYSGLWEWNTHRLQSQQEHTLSKNHTTLHLCFHLKVKSVRPSLKFAAYITIALCRGYVVILDCNFSLNKKNSVFHCCFYQFQNRAERLCTPGINIHPSGSLTCKCNSHHPRGVFNSNQLERSCRLLMSQWCTCLFEYIKGKWDPVRGGHMFMPCVSCPPVIGCLTSWFVH